MDTKYCRELEKAAIDFLVTYRDRKSGDHTQLMTIPQAVIELASIIDRDSQNRDHRQTASEVWAFIAGQPASWEG